MSEVIFLLIGLGAGIPAGAFLMDRRRKRQVEGTAQQLPEHEHLWGEWEYHQETDVWGEHPEHPVAFDMTQKRQCQTCGYTEYHTERF